ncbi:MAG: hypothetical protein NVSMB56_01860 [Pyrinomonadaceae bacterium]
MPFRRIDFSVFRSLRPSRGWRRELLLDDWGLKILALIITFGLWYGVRVQLGEERVEKTFAGVVVREADNNPTTNLTLRRTANVVVRVPRSLAESVRAENVSIVVEKNSDGKKTARFVSPSGMENQIELISSTPPLSTLADTSR